MIRNGHKIQYTEEDLQQMRELILSGKSVVEVSKTMGMSRAAFFLHAFSGKPEHEEFAAAYREAKIAYIGAVMDQIIETASAPLHPNPKFANAAVARQRLIVDTAKWCANRLLPKIWGDKIQVEHTGEVKVSPLAQLRQLENKVLETKKVLDAEVVEVGQEKEAQVAEDDCF